MRERLRSSCAITSPVLPPLFLSSHFDEVAFWFLTCSSFTTCFTFGTADATSWARARSD